MREPGTQKRPERSWSRRKTGFRRKAEEGYLRRSENPPDLSVGSVKHSTLSSQLKQLEAEGMVKRTVYPEVPPRVEYELTELGQTFQPVLDAVGSWGERYIEYLDAQEKKEGMKEDAK